MRARAQRKAPHDAGPVITIGDGTPRGGECPIEMLSRASSLVYGRSDKPRRKLRSPLDRPPDVVFEPVSEPLVLLGEFCQPSFRLVGRFV
jgi:hypothetical protein